MEVETCGDCWTAESVMTFIYTPVTPIALVSKSSTTNRPILLAIIVLSPTVALSVPYSVLKSRGPRGGPAGGTTKSPGRGGMAQGSPSSSVNSQEGRYYEGGRASPRETISGRGRQGTTGDDTMSSVLVLGSRLSGKFRK